MAYQSSFAMASSWECTGRLLISFQPFLGDALVPHAPGRTAREVERGIALLFADRRQDMDAAVFDLDRVSDLPLGIANLDLMQPADLFLIHLRMVCSPSPARRSTQWLKSSQRDPGRTARCRGLHKTDRGCRFSDVVLRVMDRWLSNLAAAGPVQAGRRLMQRHRYAYPARDLLRQFYQRGVSSASRALR